MLEGIAKHVGYLVQDEDALLDVVEAMIFYARDEPRLSAIYGVVSEETRTVPVNIRVLHRTLDRAGEGLSREKLDAVYGATFELFVGLEQLLDEIAAGPAAWDARVNEAVEAGRRALAIKDGPTALLVLWYLGRLSRTAEIARRSGRVIAGEAWISDAGAPLRLLRAWVLSRVEVHDVSARRSLRREVLGRESDVEVLRLLGDVSRGSEEHDLLQKVLDVERAP